MSIVRLPSPGTDFTYDWASQAVRAIENQFYLDGNAVSALQAWQAALQGYVINVLDYGATGNGTTNDTVAVQAALTAAGTKSVWFPPGSYLVDTLAVTEGCTLIGSGPNATTLLCRSNSTTIFNYLALTSIRTGFAISGFTFASNGKTTCTAIHLDGNTTGIRISQVRISDCDIEGTFAYGVLLKYCANTFVSNLFMAAVVNGVYIDNCTDTDIVSVKVQSGTGYGFYILGGVGAFDEGVRLVACSTNGQAFGLGINGQDWGVATSCSFTTCASGALIAASATNWKFSACEFAVGGVPAQPGVTLDASCARFAFNACQISNNTFGLILRGTNHTVSGNVFIANSNVDVYADGALHCPIFGNQCDSVGVANSIQEFGAANYNAITGNVMNGAVVTLGANTLSTGNIPY